MNIPMIAIPMGGVGTGADLRFIPRVHQQVLTTSPFGNTREADIVSPEVAHGGLQDRDVYNQDNIKWILTQYITVYLAHLSLKSTPHSIDLI
jgi:hypothetical protein